MNEKKSVEKKLFCFSTKLNQSYMPDDMGVITKLFSSGFFREIKGGYKI